MKITPEWLTGPLRGLMDGLNAAGFDAYAVGGCVRDAILDVSCNDVDVATNARPNMVRETLQAAGYKLIPTGVEHGTWTVRAGKDMFEVTTYRQDVTTDGRRATVEFADTMEQDAERRDFTMNAMYMDKGGNVFDPTGQGLRDLEEGRVRFVGDANERCTEDYLRILRLYRFYAKYGKGTMDSEAWAAAQAHREGLVTTVSGERIWSELRKILALPAPVSAVQEMYVAGVLDTLFGHMHNFESFKELVGNEETHRLPPNWPRRYFALVGKTIPFPHAKSEARYLEALYTSLAHTNVSDAVLVNMFDVQLVRDRAALLGRAAPVAKEDEVRGFHARFPVLSADLMAVGVREGPELGKAMRRAKDLWYASDLTATKEELVCEVLGA